MSEYEIMSPGHYYNEDGSYDLTGHIGPLFPLDQSTVKWPMYSFNRPSFILWNSIGKELFKNGWTDEKIESWLKSKSPRWALDGELGDSLEQLGTKFAQEILKETST